jgi:predicted DNA repair protein MutK
MASTLLTLLDDISTILDDVATMSKVALKKTAGVVGDDLALNAQQIVGVEVNRELPVVWSVAKGSAVNKLILVPIALAISALLPGAVLLLLMIGGAYLCYEGFEKILHKWLHGRAQTEQEHAEHVEALARPEIDVVAAEKQKIRGAIRTDFVLSAEIIVIALGTVSEATLGRQLVVLGTIAALMTVGVYGLVACIIKLDDVGLYFSLAQGERPAPRLKRTVGRAILKFAPWLMRGLSFAGTVAMFTVGGGILTHGIGPLHHAIEQVAHGSNARELLVPPLLHLAAGILAGALLVACMQLAQELRRRWSSPRRSE